MTNEFLIPNVQERSRSGGDSSLVIIHSLSGRRWPNILCFLAFLAAVVRCSGFSPAQSADLQRGLQDTGHTSKVTPLSGPLRSEGRGSPTQLFAGDLPDSSLTPQHTTRQKVAEQLESCRDAGDFHC